MFIKRSLVGLSITLGLFTLCATAQDLTVEQVIANHVKSFGQQSAIEASRNRLAAGNSEFEIVATAKKASGTAAFASDGKDMALFSTFGLRDYRMERIGWFGGKVNVPVVEQGHRSPLGEFLNAYDKLITNRLLGGSIFSTWLLYSKEDVGGQFEMDGKKKVDGKDAWVLKYIPKGGLGPGSTIKLYFDASTFRHIRTVYRQAETERGFYNSMGVGKGNVPNGWDQDMANNGSTLTEEFSDFSSDAAGITLPHKYAIRLAIDSAQGTGQFAWRFVFHEFKLIKAFPSDFFSFKADVAG